MGATSKTTKLRVRVGEVEVELHGRIGRVQSLSIEGTFEAGAVEVLGDLLRMFGPDRRELEEQREHVTALQVRGTELVERNRTLKAHADSLAEGIPAMVGNAFAAGQKHERGLAARRAKRGKTATKA